MIIILWIAASFTFALGNADDFQREFKKSLRKSDIFGVITDVHLHDEPETQCSKYQGKYSNVGCDSDDDLVDAAVNSFYQMLSDAKPGGAAFILHLGDNSWHFKRNNLTKDMVTIYNLTSAVFEKFENQSIPVVATFGNNDFPIKYHLNMSAFYPTVMELYRSISTVEKKSEVADDFDETFSEGGYFSVKIYQPKIRVISLNTLYLSTSVKDAESQKAYGEKQLDWVERTLASLDKDERVIFIGHHPPGISLFYLYEDGEAIGQWQPLLLERFLNITSSYHQRITANFFGHCHSNVLNFAADQMVTISSPSVSPVYGGQPSYQLALLDKKDKSLTDIITFNTWLDYYARQDIVPKFITYESLRKLLRVPNLKLASLLKVQDRLLDEESLPLHTALKSRFYQGRYSPALSPHLLYCFTVNLERSDFLDCIADYGYDTANFSA